MKITKTLIAYCLVVFSFIGYFVLKPIIIKAIMPKLFFSYIQDDYPTSWDSLKIGDKREFVHKKLGKTQYNIWEWKGDVWTEDNPVGWYRCRVSYNTDTIVDGYYIEAFFGNKETFSKELIKSESLKTLN